MNSLEKIRDKITLYFEDVNTPIGIGINVAILALSVLSLTMFIIQTYPISPGFREILNQIDTFVLILFTIEYGLRLWAAKSRLKFVFDFFSIIDLISIIPLFLGWFDIRFFRIFRWFRLLKIIRLANSDLFAVKFKLKDQVIFIRIYLILFSTVFIYTGLIYQIEHPKNPELFNNFFDALYYCIVTMTTVGFGDIIPLSESGRVLTVLMILTGIVLIPWQVGDLVKQLLKISNQSSRFCTGCGLSVHDLDAHFCKLCGTKLWQLVIPEETTSTNEKLLLPKL
ncbi:MAG: ion transporter [Microcystaceae cyanobacterium]